MAAPEPTSPPPKQSRPSSSSSFSSFSSSPSASSSPKPTPTATATAATVPAAAPAQFVVPAVTVAAATSPSTPAPQEMEISPTNSPSSPTAANKELLTVSAAASPPLPLPPLSAPRRPTSSALSSPSATIPASALSMSSSALSHAPAAPTKKVLERNQACLGCRQRKRKCDGGKPSCGACERLERECVYAHSTVTKIHTSSYYRDSQSSPLPSTNRSGGVGGGGSNSSAKPSRDSTSPSHVRVRSSTPTRVLPASSKSASNSHSAFTPINAEMSATERQSSPAKSVTSPPYLTNGNNANPRKRAFSERNDDSPPAHSENVGKHESDSYAFAWQFLQASRFGGFEPVDISLMPAVEDLMNIDPSTNLALDTNYLPPSDTIHELFAIFFEKWHSILPCLYKKNTMEDIQPGGRLVSEPNTLTYAVLALAGYLHPDPAIKSASQIWADDAQEHFNRAVSSGRYSLYSVQGGLYLCLRMFGLGQFSQMWIFLSSIWRMCQPLGLHQIDASSPFKGFLPEPRSEQELEERRRTVWAVYILDRLASIPVPWTMNIVDREFCVNFPAPEETFQNGSMQNVEHMIIDPFPSSLDHLLPPTTTSPHTLPNRDAYQYLCKLSVLLGRIASYNRSLHSQPFSESDKLDIALTRFIFNIPKKYRSVQDVASEELPTVLLLNALMHTCTILLHHPRRMQELDQKSVKALEGSGRCQKAVDNVIHLLRSISSFLDPDDERVLGNPFLGGPLFIAASVLLCKLSLEKDSTDGEGTHSLIELVLGVLGRLEEVWPRLAGMLRSLVVADLGKARGGVADRFLTS